MERMIICDNLIDNGKAEIFKVHRAGDNYYSGDGYAIKYDHKKAIEGVKYDLSEVCYSYGNDHEEIDNTYITNSYLLSVYEFIRKCDVIFKKNDGSWYGTEKYVDDSDPNRKVDRILPPKETDGFIFSIDFEKFIKEKTGICSFEHVNDGDYLIIMNNRRPMSKDPESFFEEGFEIVDKEIVIPTIDFKINNCNYDQFKMINDLLNSLGLFFTCETPASYKDDFYAAKSKYEREKENEQNI